VQFHEARCSVLRTSPPCNARRVPVCCGSSRGAGSSRRRPRPRCGKWEHGGGFSLDAVIRIEATDRKGLERLLRYCARPNLCERAAALGAAGRAPGTGTGPPCRAEDAASDLSAPQAPTGRADGAVSHAHGVLRAAGDPHPATTPAPSPLPWRPDPECPAACGGDRPRRPPDGGIRAGVEPALPQHPPKRQQRNHAPRQPICGRC